MKEQTHIKLNSGRKVTEFEYGLMETLGFNTERMVSTMTPVEPELEDVRRVVDMLDEAGAVQLTETALSDAEEAKVVVASPPVVKPKTGLINKFSRFIRRGKTR